MSITTRAALVRGAPGEYETATLQLDEPRSGEVLVRLVSAGLCHSDDHVATGDIPYAIYPVVGGHEGAGVVEQVGDGVSELAVGDHVIFSFLAVCGRMTRAAFDWPRTARQSGRWVVSARSPNSARSAPGPRSRSTRAHRSTRSACSAAACVPGGARRSTLQALASATP